MLQSTASFVNCVGGTNGSTPTELTLDDIDEATTALQMASAYMIFDNIDGENKFGSAPVRDAFFAMANTKLIPTINRLDGFISKANYSSPYKALEAEWGTVNNVRILTSPIGSVSPNASDDNRDVYNMFICGMQSYGIVEQSGATAQFIYTSPILNGPLALNSTSGVVFSGAYQILNDEWILNLRSTLP